MKDKLLLIKASSLKSIDAFLATAIPKDYAVVEDLPFLNARVISVPAELEGHLLAQEAASVTALSDQPLREPQDEVPDAREAIVIPWSYTGDGISIAILDDGVFEHDELKGRVEHSFITAERWPRDKATFATRGKAHGTHAAGAAAGRRYAASKASIFSIQLASALAMPAAIARCVRERSRKNIRVIHTSVNGRVDGEDVEKAIAYARAAGIVTVVAAGNEGPNGIRYPGAAPSAITIGGYTDNATPRGDDDAVASRSSRGRPGAKPPKPTALLPWGRFTVPTYDPAQPARTDLYTNKFSGTSACSAIAAGEITTWFQAQPSLTPDDVVAIIEASSRKLRDPTGAEYPPEAQGFGALDIEKARAAVRAFRPRE